jgi:hypothetical protein
VNFYTTLKSRNKKTGPIPVVTASKNTCPDVCPLKGAGCYAEHGPLRLHWDNVTRGEKGGSIDEALLPIRRLARGKVWRYGQAGDLPGVGDEIDETALEKMTAANRGKRGIVFTHKPPTAENVSAFRKALEGGLTINLSANNLDHADELAETGLPVVAVLHSDYQRRRIGTRWLETLAEFKSRLKDLPKRTPSGRRIAICPATYHDIDCETCALCSNPNRNGAVVGFPAHGSRRRGMDENLAKPGRGALSDDGTGLGEDRSRSSTGVGDGAGPPLRRW